MKRLVGLFFSLSVMTAGVAWALPFNDDMVHEQIVSGQFVRPRPEGTVAVGSLSEYMRPKAEMAQVKNPVPLTFESKKRGERLFAVNCSGCHGNIGATNYKPGVAGALMGAPNIATDLYKQKSDGEIFSAVQYGGLAIMPRLGWKLSTQETWDIVNYVRHAQEVGAKVRK